MRDEIGGYPRQCKSDEPSTCSIGENGRKSAYSKKTWSLRELPIGWRIIRYVTAETPPPVQAAGDTIPKGLR